MRPEVAALLVEEAPAVIALVQGLFHRKHPELPLPTSEEVITAYEAGYLSSWLKDEQIKARA